MSGVSKCLTRAVERERRLKMTSHGLVAPLKFHDGEHFPEEARKVQWADLESYAFTVPGFWSSSRAVELEDVLKEFARSVAGIITSAPPFEADWPIIEKLAPLAAKIGLPRL